MSDLHMSPVLRRLCYVAFPVAAALVIPAFYLMPNRKHDVPIMDADPVFQLGFVMALVGVLLAILAMLVLVLGNDED